jgi:hypothetical protein
MTDNLECFTRASWRASKRRKMQKRKNAYAGRKHAPAAFLEAAKKVQFGSGIHRICHATKRDGSPCGNIALSGLAVCGPHGGFSVWARMGKLQKTGRSDAVRAARKAPRTAPKNPDLILIASKPYINASQADRIRLIRAFSQSPQHAQKLIRQLYQRENASTL